MAVVMLVRAAAACDRTDEALTRYRYQQVHMGVSWDLSLYAADETAANTASAAAFERIAALDHALSDYLPDSELSRLNATAGTGQAIALSPDLAKVLTYAQTLAQRSDGAFDVTVGPYVRQWRRARRQKVMPSDDRMAEARAAVGYRKLSLDPVGRRATLTEPNMRLDLGGIAMGYAADEAMTVLREHGITRAMIDASGDVLVSDPPPGAAGWRIGIAPLPGADGEPTRFLELANAAVTMSGDAYQFVEIGGRRYSHIVDPRTGLGIDGPSAVTVIARDGITADALATAASVLGPERGLTLIDDTPGVEALFMRASGDQLVTVESKGFAELLTAAP